MKETLYNYFASSSGITLKEVLINYAAACIIGAIIFISYKLSHTRAVYSRKFNISLVMMVMITTLIMNVIGNNIALSLGMVGALSIIRFRTVVKDSRDTAYIFWCIAAGIACGVSDYLVAGIGSVLIFLFLLLFGHAGSNDRLMLVIHVDDAHTEDVEKTIELAFEQRAQLRVQTMNSASQNTEVIYEITTQQLNRAKKKLDFSLNDLRQIQGVEFVSMVKQEDDISQ